METKTKTFLPTQEQDANFEFLVQVLETAKTYKEAKSVWYHMRKIQSENPDAWILSLKQNQEILARYNELKFGKFIEDHRKEVEAQEAVAKEIEQLIHSATSLKEMRDISMRIHKEIRIKDIKERIQETYRKAFQELRTA